MRATALASTVTIVEILRAGRDVYTNHLSSAKALAWRRSFIWV
ncbi:MAG: hypothetical protein ABGX10_00155 [Paracoccus sp. (in: a-proteobacteria)]